MAGLALLSALPLIGWLVIFPYLWLRGQGAAAVALLRGARGALRRARAKRGAAPALVLFLLAPAIGELLSGSAPPAEFFQPPTFLLLAVLYGGGALLIREVVRARGKGWPSLLALGAAYGIAEEGWMVKSFFDPNWVDLGILGEYGRWGGVNWVWSLHLTLYHAVFSIGIPILLTELAFPGRRHEPWLGTSVRRLLATLFALDILVGFLFLTPYRPPLMPYLLSIALGLGLVRLGLKLPVPPAGAAGGRWAPWALAGLSFSAATLFFLGGWVLPEAGLPPPLTMAFEASLAGGMLWLLRRAMGGWKAPTAYHALGLAAGALGFFILLAPLQEMDPARTDETAGMALVGLATALGLAWLRRRMKRSAWGEAGKAVEPLASAG